MKDRLKKRQGHKATEEKDPSRVIREAVERVCSLFGGEVIAILNKGESIEDFAQRN